MELNTENFEDFLTRLQYHNQGKGVDDHCTANPIFIVHSLKRISGIDLDYDPKYCWMDSDCEIELTDEELKIELAEYVGEGGVHDEFDISRDSNVTKDNVVMYQKIGYHEYWEYVNAHFTLEAAEAFIARKAHDHNELRVYVDSQYWCHEFNMVVNGLLAGEIVLE